MGRFPRAKMIRTHPDTDNPIDSFGYFDIGKEYTRDLVVEFIAINLSRIDIPVLRDFAGKLDNDESAGLLSILHDQRSPTILRDRKNVA